MARKKLEQLKKMQADVNDLFHVAAQKQYTYPELRSILDDFLSRPAVQHVPQWARQQLMGYIQGQMDAFVREHMEWKVLEAGANQYVRVSDIASQDWQTVLAIVPYYKNTFVQFAEQDDVEKDRTTSSNVHNPGVVVQNRRAHSLSPTAQVKG